MLSFILNLVIQEDVFFYLAFFLYFFRLSVGNTFHRSLPTNVDDLVNRFSCTIESAKCMNNSSESYPKYHVSEEDDEL